VAWFTCAIGQVPDDAVQADARTHVACLIEALTIRERRCREAVGQAFNPPFTSGVGPEPTAGPSGKQILVGGQRGLTPEGQANLEREVARLRAKEDPLSGLVASLYAIMLRLDVVAALLLALALL